MSLIPGEVLFRSEWFIGRPWIECSVKLDSAFCINVGCLQQVTQGVDSQHLRTQGFAWKNATERFRNHSGRNVHHSAMTVWTLAKTQKYSILFE